MFVDCFGGGSVGRTNCGGVVGHDAGIGVGLMSGVHCSCVLAVESRREGDEHHVYWGDVGFMRLGAVDKVIQDA